jgi:tRNA(fMet)-specific endonuclease VapC
MKNKYLLDTNICIYIIKNRPPAMREKFASLQLGDVAISSITLFELKYGAYKKPNSKKYLQVIDDFIAPLDIINFGVKSSDICAKIRAELERKGQVISLPDMQIASIALARDYVLVTNNLREFERVTSLKLENWVE